VCPRIVRTVQYSTVPSVLYSSSTAQVLYCTSTGASCSKAFRAPANPLKAPFTSSSRAPREVLRISARGLPPLPLPIYRTLLSPLLRTTRCQFPIKILVPALSLSYATKDAHSSTPYSYSSPSHPSRLSLASSSNRSGASSVSSPSPSSGARESTISVSALTYHSSVIHTDNSIDEYPSHRYLDSPALPSSPSLFPPINQSYAVGKKSRGAPMMPPTSPYERKPISRTVHMQLHPDQNILSCLALIILLCSCTVQCTTRYDYSTSAMIVYPPNRPGQSLLSEACSTDIIVRLIVN